MKTPIQSAISKILDESFAASVKLLKEEGLLSENIVFTEKDTTISGGGEDDPHDEYDERKSRSAEEVRREMS